MNNLMSTNHLKTEAESRLHDLERTKERLEKQLANSPEGKIHVVKSSKRIQYYLRRKPAEKSGKYLAKSNQKLIKTYLQKSYNEKVIKLIKREISMLKIFLEGYRDYPADIRNEYSLLPISMQNLLDPVDISDEEYAKEWEKIPFKPKETENETTPYLTEKGEYVRSKSELNIANALSRHNIPYKYEYPLELRKGLVIHPDFTVLNIKKRKIYYWEHRGMMDDREYAKHAVQRIKDYGNANIFVGRDLLITEETANNPLGSKEITSIIKTFLK